MAEHPVVLALQDTTQVDFNGQKIDGLGRLSYEAQRGMYLHPTYVVRRNACRWALSMPGCGRAPWTCRKAGAG